MAFDGGEVVPDTGLLAIRQLDRELGILSEAAARLPDPRSELLCKFSTEQLLTQTVYQFLGGYFDCNDAQTRAVHKTHLTRLCRMESSFRRSTSFSMEENFRCHSPRVICVSFWRKSLIHAGVRENAIRYPPF